MSAKPYRPIGKDHPIALDAAPGRVVVRVGNRTIADSSRAISLKEARYPAVLYIPRADVDMSLLERTDHHSHCPFKGEASYFSVRDGGARSVNAAWSYETPFDQVAGIAGHLAFYPDRVDAIEVVKS